MGIYTHTVLRAREGDRERERQALVDKTHVTHKRDAKKLYENYYNK